MGIQLTSLLIEVRVNFPGEGQALLFKTTQDVERWINSESEFWRSVDVATIRYNLRQQWEKQRNFFEHASSMLQDFERCIEQNQEKEARQINHNLCNLFNRLEDGEIITSDCRFYPAIVDMAETSPEMATILLVAAKNDPDNALGTIDRALPVSHIIRLILEYGRSVGTRDWLQPQREELTGIRGDFQDHLDELRASFSAQDEAILKQRKTEEQAHQEREGEWTRLKERMESEWDALKRVYDEKLALLAPTEYWEERANSHKRVAGWFSLAFGAMLLTFVALFSWLAMPRLFELASQKDVSPILTLVPVAVLAFAGLWVLKILSRLFSENLQMMRNAREREIMVKTFLALMRDDENGKTLVDDNDRILILHALFRPSSINAVDDAPPVHWFDILTNKVSGKGGTSS